MNFGKNCTYYKRRKLVDTTPIFGRRKGISFLRLVFTFLFAAFVVFTCFISGATKGILDSCPDISDVNIMPSGYATLIYDVNGDQMQKLTSSSSNRMSVSIEKIPLDMQHAIVAIEDERFYEHEGIDVRGILRAFVKGVGNGFNFSEGASTLTQQLLKNNVFTNWTSEGKIERFKRKFQEQYLAVKLESSLKKQGENPKEVILENYLNTVNFGAGTYGVQAAAMKYFSKNINELTLSECAVLAAIPQNPTKYNPISHPEENAKRREKVLNNMYTQGYITATERDTALADDVYSRIQENDVSTTTEAPYSYFVDELIDQVINDLQEQKGYTKVQAQNALYSGGLRIYTTQDPEIQAICDEEYSDPDNFPSGSQIGIDWALSVKKLDGTIQNYSVEMLRLYFRNKDPDFELLFDSEEEAQAAIDEYKASVIKEGETIVDERLSYSPQPQSSMVIMDQQTGEVKALVGGRGEKTASLTLNRASNTYRQPGSTFKILSTYAPALESGMTLATTFNDEEYSYEDGTPVRNWLNNSYHGATTVRYAIEQSVNVVAVKCLTSLNPQTGFDFLKTLGFSNLVEEETINGQVYSDIKQPLALGGITYGVSNLELTAAYSAIANGGTYIKPRLYTKILDQNGDVVLENDAQETRVMKESTAWLLTSAMEDVVTKGTGTDLQLNNMSVAGKTGTTSAYNDVWFAGFTPYYTCTVWAGYDNNEKLSPEGNNRTFHRTLWRKVMNRIHENLSNKDFTQPSSVEEATICSISGKLASSGCPTITEYFDKSTIPTEHCSSHNTLDSQLYQYDPVIQTEKTDSDAGGSSEDTDDTNYSDDSDSYSSGSGSGYDGDSGD